MSDRRSAQRDLARLPIGSAQRRSPTLAPLPGLERPSQSAAGPEELGAQDIVDRLADDCRRRARPTQLLEATRGVHDAKVGPETDQGSSKRLEDGADTFEEDIEAGLGQRQTPVAPE